MENLKLQFEKFLTALQNETADQINSRKNAFDKFLNTGFPTPKEEAWQFTDLKELINTDLVIRTESAEEKDISEIKNTLPNSYRIVLIDGKMNASLSFYKNEIAVYPINKAFDQFDIPGANSSNPFISLNNAFFNGGYYIDVVKNVEEPIHIINILTGADSKTLSSQINLISVKDNCSAYFVEENISSTPKDLFVNNVFKILLGRNSHLNYLLLQNNTKDESGINNYFIEQHDDSSFSSNIFSKNGKLIRNEIDVKLNGQNCNSNIFGLVLVDGKDHIENYTNIIHNKDYCNSKQLFKYILKDSAEGVFNGLVKVQPGAQKTDSQQTNKNLLLSKNALMNSNPQLEIYADDVKCSHGSATGEFDDETIFYLRSRGLDIVTAKALLIEGFAKEITDEIKNDHIKNNINTIITEWLK